jgi:hypothetical protein
MRRVIFLDIDGVLNTPREWGRRDAEAFAPRLVHRLHRIVGATGAHVVVSSTWRLHHMLDELRGYTGLGARLVGATPFLPGLSRGLEIDVWLARHPDVGEFVILDDDADMLPHLSRLVQTDYHHGLRPADVSEAIRRLKGEPPVLRPTLQGNRTRSDDSWL